MTHYHSKNYSDPIEFADVIRTVFQENDNEAKRDSTIYDYNWLILSTSGVHGSYMTLDDYDAMYLDVDGGYLSPEEAIEEFGLNADGSFAITANIYQPRLASLHYGEALFSRDDIPWLREAVGYSLDGIISSQTGNSIPLKRPVYTYPALLSMAYNE